jgi:hypothetical protein
MTETEEKKGQVQLLLRSARVPYSYSLAVFNRRYSFRDRPQPVGHERTGELSRGFLNEAEIENLAGRHFFDSSAKSFLGKLDGAFHPILIN